MYACFAVPSLVTGTGFSTMTFFSTGNGLSTGTSYITGTCRGTGTSRKQKTKNGIFILKERICLKKRLKCNPIKVFCV